MSSRQIEDLFEPDPNDGPAAKMYLDAFKRLAFNIPENLEKGTVVSQNNVAKEAGKDASALKRSRFPGVIRKIQTYVELTNSDETKKQARNAKVQKGKLSLQALVTTLKLQLGESQSKVLSTERKIIELIQENADLKTRIDELQSLPTSLKR
nr:hypothetical protein [Herbaspirillum sp. ASV7]